MSQSINPDALNSLDVATSGALSTRDAVMIRLTLETGLRRSELLALTHGDVDHVAKTFKVKTLKRGQPRTLPAPAYFLAYVVSTRAHGTARIFPISRQRLQQIWEVWRPYKVKFHALRHTFARRLYRKTKDIRLVQKSLGHKSLSSTTVYLDEEYDQETVRKAFGIK